MAKRNYKSIFIAIVIIAVVFCANRFLFNNILQNIAYGTFGSIGKYLSQQLPNVAKYADALFNRSALMNENDKMKKDNTNLLSKLVNYQFIEQENRSLRNQLNIPLKNQHSLMMAKIISVDRSNVSSTILIDRGANDGVKKSMAVIAGGNILAGIIDEVFNDYSRIILPDDPRSSVSVKIGDFGIIGEAEGGSGENGIISVNFVTNKDPVQEGDLVITSGLDNIAESFLVGKVEKITLEGGSLLKEVRVELIFNLNLGPNLFIVIN